MKAAKDFRVAVVGAGMSGLACAYALIQRGIEVEVFEASDRLGEIGAGVGLGPNALRTLQYLGLYNTLLEHTGSKPIYRAARFVSGYGMHESVFENGLQEEEQPEYGLAVYRPVFIEAVRKLLDPALIHLNKRLVSITQSFVGERQLNILIFADGTTFSADLVIGADGVKSAVRSTILPGSNAVFMNTTACRGLIPVAELRKKADQDTMDRVLSGRTMCYIGMDKLLVVYPIQKNQTINVVVFESDFDTPKGSISIPVSQWVQPASHEDLLHKFQSDSPSWGKDVIVLLQHLKEQEPALSRWHIHAVHPPLEQYSDPAKKVVLVGDAAHAMLPHYGAGSGQCFEDVHVLSELLAHPSTTSDTLPIALEVYDRHRRPSANQVLSGSRQAGQVYQSYDPRKAPEDMKKYQEAIHATVAALNVVWRGDSKLQAAAACKDLSIALNTS